METDKLREVVGAIPAGHWMSYADVCEAAGGTARHARALNGRLTRAEIEGAHRVLLGNGAIAPTALGDPTAVRERLPILSILSNNFSMAIELKVMPVSTEKYRSTDISGNYADFAKALGGYGERVTEPGQIKDAIKRGIQKTKEGTPALLEFITEKATDVSRFP